jgi:hypothetical protein
MQVIRCGTAVAILIWFCFFASEGYTHAQTDVSKIEANDNRLAAGKFADGVLTLRLA